MKLRASVLFTWDSSQLLRKGVPHFLVAALGVGLLSASNAASATTRPSNDDLAAQCRSFASADFSELPDAPTQITESIPVGLEGKGPAYCRMRGYAAPQIGFELRLPLRDWNSKLIEVGCGGWCGVIDASACDGPLQRRYACISSDMGHKGAVTDLVWAINNQSAQIDFGYRATHVAAVVGKAIAKAYYSQAPRRSYFVGCSTGGYQGVMAAQRYPWDFDGILAGAPDIDQTAASIRVLWIAKNFLDGQGKPRLTHDDLQLLHKAALNRCDEDDGVKDGIIGNPLACEFDPQELVCESANAKSCLTATKAEVARRLYAGPMTSDRKSISAGGYTRGSELLWDQLWPPSSTEQYFKFGLAGYSPEPKWRYTEFDFDHDYKRVGGLVWFDNSNPDLRKFKQAGGKLIVYHGGADTMIPPGSVVDYYETVERTMGGRPSTQDFFRLFIVPGMNHCTGGEGAFTVDWLSYLEAWVERDEPPNVVMSARVSEDYLAAQPLPENSGIPSETVLPPDIHAAVVASRLTLPLDPAVRVSFTRPIYPYPLFAKRKGTGNPSDAANFIPSK